MGEEGRLRQLEGFKFAAETKFRRIAHRISSSDVTEPPTANELDAAFGTPAVCGEGFIGFLDDNGAGAAVWLCAVVNGLWRTVALDYLGGVLGSGTADAWRILTADGIGGSFWADTVRLPDNRPLVLGDSLDLEAESDGTNILIDNDLEIRISNAPDGANYLAIETDGTLEFNGNATVWDDLRIVPGSFDRPGVSDPAMVAYNPGGAGVATYLYEFALNNVASFTAQIPHNYKQGSPIYVHIHWTPRNRGVAEAGATVGWKVDYSWANIDGTFGAMGTADLSDACDGTNHKHQMTPEVAIAGAGKNISSMLLCNVKRTDTGADDTWAGAIAGQLPLLCEIDFHYEIDTVGSRQQSAK